MIEYYSYFFLGAAIGSALRLWMVGVKKFVHGFVPDVCAGVLGSLTAAKFGSSVWAYWAAADRDRGITVHGWSSNLLLFLFDHQFLGAVFASVCLVLITHLCTRALGKIRS